MLTTFISGRWMTTQCSQYTRRYSIRSQCGVWWRGLLRRTRGMDWRTSTRRWCGHCRPSTISHLPRLKVDGREEVRNDCSHNRGVIRTSIIIYDTYGKSFEIPWHSLLDVTLCHVPDYIHCSSYVHIPLLWMSCLVDYHILFFFFCVPWGVLLIDLLICWC